VVARDGTAEIPERPTFADHPTAADPTDTAPGCGNSNSPNSPKPPAWTSSCATTHPAPANGTRPNTGSSPKSPLNWRGRPLETYQIVNLIANTTTGLTIRCQLDPNTYPTKIKLTKQQKASIPITRHKFHGDWDYTVHSQKE
jgi:hypothetical protein